jgi:hypothetical protein
MPTPPARVDSSITNTSDPSRLNASIAACAATRLRRGIDAVGKVAAER